MSDSCCAPSKMELANLAAQNIPFIIRASNVCPECGQRGKSVSTQTLKALLAVTLRQMRDAQYLYCRTRACPVVYFSADGAQTFTADAVRERVFHKEPDADDVFVCYCFRHSVGDLHTATPEERQAILNDINDGIRAAQCACDLRNPQGDCCLGNVRQVVKRFEYEMEGALR